ncbi:hypothetical protein CY34DRAFT_812185 [Suillus luteus UH-Slu-Lm8-n1]|uniref:Fungal-type protein kinase domain-containing protein n=1 Tax=Suillus luteus UH-Slu-Lm8-n1 TaxID=930992 RepID=A0A0D0AU26_9AGAM|nr:hypothetical protein CY34DRAFT_812185 [Suillus luteus UH-Slu-Lm8-n1]
MANNAAGATAQETPAHNSAFAVEAGLKPTPQAIDVAVVSKHIIFATTHVKLRYSRRVTNKRPSIVRDVQDFEKCEPETIRQELHASCTGLPQVFKPERGFSKNAEQANPGSRVLTIIVLRKLLPITVLSGKEFLAAWWQIVKCHYTLWKIGVHHRDVNPSNLTGYRLVCGQFIGVLSDWDLSSDQRGSPSRLEHTGTVPFMALDLLTPGAIAGKVEHMYVHDAESFIWVLAWVCLRYEGGKLISKDRPLEELLKVDALACAVKKAYFFMMELCDLRPSESHKVSWDLVNKCFLGIHSLYTPRRCRKLDDQSAFELLLGDPMQGLL